MNHTKGKKLNFGVDSGKLINSLDHVGESFEVQNTESPINLGSISDLRAFNKIESRNAYNDTSKTSRNTKQLLSQIIKRQRSIDKIQMTEVKDPSENIANFYNSKLPPRNSIAEIKRRHLNSYMADTSQRNLNPLNNSNLISLSHLQFRNTFRLCSLIT